MLRTVCQAARRASGVLVLTRWGVCRVGFHAFRGRCLSSIQSGGARALLSFAFGRGHRLREGFKPESALRVTEVEAAPDKTQAPCLRLTRPALPILTPPEQQYGQYSHRLSQFTTRAREGSCEGSSILFFPVYLSPWLHPPSRLPLYHLCLTARHLLVLLHRLSYRSRTA